MFSTILVSRKKIKKCSSTKNTYIPIIYNTSIGFILLSSKEYDLQFDIKYDKTVNLLFFFS